MASIYAGVYVKDISHATICCPASEYALLLSLSIAQRMTMFHLRLLFVPVLGAEETEFVKECREGKCTLLMDDPDGLAESIKKSCYSKYLIPKNKQVKASSHGLLLEFQLSLSFHFLCLY